MSRSSSFQANALKPSPLAPSAAIADGLQRARRMYRRASEELFQLCYAIQVTGELPHPVSLTESLIQYRQARALLQALDVQPSAACDWETLVRTPVESK